MDPILSLDPREISLVGVLLFGIIVLVRYILVKDKIIAAKDLQLEKVNADTIDVLRDLAAGLRAIVNATDKNKEDILSEVGNVNKKIDSIIETKRRAKAEFKKNGIKSG